MDIAYFTRTEPFPPDEGGKMVAYNRIKRLAERGHNIHLFSATDSRPTIDTSSDLLNHCSSYLPIVRKRGFNEYIRNFKTPYSISSRSDPELETVLNSLNPSIDIVFCEHTHMSSYANSVDYPSCVGIHNIEYKSLIELAASVTPSVKSALYMVEAAKMYLYEKMLFSNSNIDVFVFLSREEQAFIDRHMLDFGIQSTYSPIGVATDRFEIDAELPSAYLSNSTESRLVFTGTMRYPPNVDAVTWFANDVFPTIRSELPNAKFFIVGKSPTPEVEALASIPGVVVTGQVPAIEPYLLHADVSVVPIRHGSGVQVKLLEALASGNITVTTPVAIRGTDIQKDKHVLVRSSSQGFAKATILASKSPHKYQEMVSRAHRLLETQYSWDKIINNLERILRRVVHKYDR